MPIAPQGIAVVATYDCNLACRHCFFSARRRPDYLAPDMLDAALASLREPLRWLHLTGGEPLLKPRALDALLDVVQSRHEYDVGIATNGYWGSDAEQATKRVEQLRRKGITGICVSVDSFHQPGVPTASVINAACAISQAGLGRHSYLVCSLLPDDYDGAEDTNERSRQLARDAADASDLPIAETPVRPIGRPSALARRPDVEALPSGPCRDLACCLGETTLFEPQMLWLDPFGNVMICYGITIGNLSDASMQEILDRYETTSNPVLQALADGGPRAVYDLAAADGVAPDGAFADECELCFHTRRALQQQHPELLTPNECYPGACAGVD